MELDHTSIVTSKCQFPPRVFYLPRHSLKWGVRDGGVFDRHRDGSAEYYAPSGHVRHYNPPYYNDEDRSDGGCSSSESPDETDSERDDYRERGLGRGYYVLGDRLEAARLPGDSESSFSSEDVPDSGSETETDDDSDRCIPDEYESGSGYDRDDRDSYGDSYDHWDDDDYDDYGEYDGTVYPILLLIRFPASVYSYIPRLRRRLRLLSLSQDYQELRLNFASLGGSQGCPKYIFTCIVSINLSNLVAGAA